MRFSEYIEENIKWDRKEAAKKVVNTIRSAKTDGQLQMAQKMADNFEKLYGGNTFWEDVISIALPFKNDTEIEKIESALEKQKFRVKYIKDLMAKFDK